MNKNICKLCCNTLGEMGIEPWDRRDEERWTRDQLLWCPFADSPEDAVDQDGYFCLETGKIPQKCRMYFEQVVTEQTDVK